MLNRDGFGTVPLFSVYPEGVGTFQIKEEETYDSSFCEVLLQHNTYNRKIFDFVHQEGMVGRGGNAIVGRLLSTNRLWGTDGHFKMLYPFPFVDENNVETVVHKVLEA